MTTPQTERRREHRYRHGITIELIVSGVPIRARLGDISFGGLRFHVDPESVDFIRAKIDAVRFDGSPPLAIKVIWGFFDGTIGAAFESPIAAEPVVTRILEQHHEFAAAS